MEKYIFIPIFISFGDEFSFSNVCAVQIKHGTNKKLLNKNSAKKYGCQIDHFHFSFLYLFLGLFIIAREFQHDTFKMIGKKLREKEINES